jgi:CheY-like chemotaxis protein
LDKRIEDWQFKCVAVKKQSKILIVDDEWGSPIVKAVRRRLDEEEWCTVAVQPEAGWLTGDEFEAAALYAIEEEQPEGVLLDVRLGEYK